MITDIISHSEGLIINITLPTLAEIAVRSVATEFFLSDNKQPEGKQE